MHLTGGAAYASTENTDSDALQASHIDVGDKLSRGLLRLQFQMSAVDMHGSLCVTQNHPSFCSEQLLNHAVNPKRCPIHCRPEDNAIISDTYKFVADLSLARDFALPQCSPQPLAAATLAGAS